MMRWGVWLVCWAVIETRCVLRWAVRLAGELDGIDGGCLRRGGWLLCVVFVR